MDLVQRGSLADLTVKWNYLDIPTSPGDSDTQPFTSQISSQFHIKLFWKETSEIIFSNLFICRLKIGTKCLAWVLTGGWHSGILLSNLICFSTSWISLVPSWLLKPFLLFKKPTCWFTDSVYFLPPSWSNTAAICKNITRLGAV